MDIDINMGAIDPCPPRGDGSCSANEKLRMNECLVTTLKVMGRLSLSLDAMQPYSISLVGWNC